MPRKEARIFTSIWQDEDFVALAPEAQRMYFLLLSQPELSLCGRLLLAENQWAGTARGMTKAKVRSDLAALVSSEPRPFVLADYATDELLIRSFIRRDRILLGPKLIKPLVAAVTVVRSAELRRAIRDELQAAQGEAAVHRDNAESVDFMIKMLSPQVNTLSNRVSDRDADRVPDRAKEKGVVVTVGSRKAGSPRGTRIPADFATTGITAELVAWAKQKVPHVNGKLETEKFVNYWTAKSGAGAVKLDWPATWRNWMLEAAQRNGQLPLSGTATVSPRDEFMRRR